MAHSQLLLKDNDRCVAMQADLRDVDGILASPKTRELIDFEQPVGLFMFAAAALRAGFVGPGRPAGPVPRAPASGSFLAVTHVAADAGSAGLDKAIEAYQSTQNNPIPRTHDEVLRFFDGFEMVEPGLVGCAMWNPQGVGDMSEDPSINLLPYAGVGRLL